MFVFQGLAPRLRYIAILKDLYGLVPETVIPAKAGIEVLFLGPRFRGYDNQGNLALANATPVPRRAGATTVESVLAFETCHSSHRRQTLPLLLLLFFAFIAFFSVTSCTLVTQSPYLVQKTRIASLEDGQGVKVSRFGHVPYQKWRIAPWEDELRYVWIVGNYDFRRCDGIDLILYFHGTHPKDYYQVFRKELEQLALKRPTRPFLFIGLVDSPDTLPEFGGKERWGALVPKSGERPEPLFQLVNQIFKAVKVRFPNIRKENTHLVLAGFSGGGRVLSAVGNWLARSEKDDPYAEVFRSRLTKIVYFDCWFDKDVLETIPTLLENNPDMKIVGTVHMKKPLEHATLLAGKFKMKADKKDRHLVGLDGRIRIYRDDSHWQAMISRLKEAL